MKIKPKEIASLFHYFIILLNGRCSTIFIDLSKLDLAVIIITKHLQTYINANIIKSTEVYYQYKFEIESNI